VSAPEFTPGPWKAVKWVGGPRYITAQHMVIAVISVRDEPEQGAADANLIAAAPEMYEALWLVTRAHDSFKTFMGQHWDGDPLADACEVARAALAKATGSAA